MNTKKNIDECLDFAENDEPRKKKFDKTLLDNIINRDEAVLLEEIDNPKREMKIKYKCSCGKECEKNFRMMAENSGAYCEECTKENKKSKTKSTNLEVYGVEYNSQNQEIKDKKKRKLIKKIWS